VTLEQMKVFEQAALLGSFTRAADRMGLAQPSISRIVGDLEAEWKCELFHRTGRGVVLTEIGHEALRRIQPVLRTIDGLGDDMQSLGGLAAGNVAVALPPSQIRTFLPTLLNTLRRERPAIRLRIYEGFSEQAVRWLAEGAAQVALYSEYSLEGEARRTEQNETFVLSNARVALSGPTNGINSDSIEFRQLADYPLVLPAPTNGLRLLVESLARRLSVPLSVVAEADSILAQEALALECGCYMLRGEIKTDQSYEASTFRGAVIQNPTIQRRMVLGTAQQSQLSRAARDVASFATAILRSGVER
jgi:LysR family transcriptional regulator, nitrogen assimilation regulatory protein